MLNKQKGNMYPWVTHTWNPIKGRCPHRCSYCYMRKYWDRLGNPYLDTKCFKDNLGEGNTIFVGSSIDMWAKKIPLDWIAKVLDYIEKYPKNMYLFQSKNPLQMANFVLLFPSNSILGTTIETNRDYNISFAPSVKERVLWLKLLSKTFKTMVSIEPILDFDLDILVSWIKSIQPDFVSIGADSKGHGLPEPPRQKILKLIDELKKFTEVKVKSNLKRIIG